MNIIYLSEEFKKFWSKIENRENFAFMRNADGERAIMLGEAVSAQEGNWKSPNYVTKLGRDLYDSLLLENDNVYYAISCPCCDNEAYYWYSTRVVNKNRTFANLWINKNYYSFLEKFDTLERDAVLIANFRAEGKKIGNLNILKHYKINDDCVSFWENEASKMISEIQSEYGDKKNILYVVSAGPMSGPIIAKLYQNNPDNCYIDFGSAIDKYYRDEISRPYMIKGNVYAERNCWMDNPIHTNFDVSIVLNLYKRPENLELQLKAIEDQTLKPKEVILFKDGISDGTIIEIPQKLKNKFNEIKISEINKGVWGRFEFAKNQAKSKYVCVFDDDTIPGKRWLENCHCEMLKQEGLYGTIGIVMERAGSYPTTNYYRVGWAAPLNTAVEVDFVGHSWFFQKEWLNCLFTAPQEIQEFKLVGEDMSFSYTLYENMKIKTFVPRHPKGEFDLYGSNPELAIKLGKINDGVSMNTNNLKNMNSALNILIERGWKTLDKRKPQYVKYLKKCLKKGKYKESNKVFFCISSIVSKCFDLSKDEEKRYIIFFGIKLTMKR